jgi:hypothetical protein
VTTSRFAHLFSKPSKSLRCEKVTKINLKLSGRVMRGGGVANRKLSSCKPTLKRSGAQGIGSPRAPRGRFPSAISFRISF